MELRKLGHSNIKVSKICLGTMTFGEQNSEKDAHDQLNYASANGINFIDTAELYAVPIRKETYTLTEQYIGTWLKDQVRDRIVLASKIAGPSDNITWIRDDINFSDESIDTALNGSLKRLQTDYLDLYQLHWPERNTNRFGIRNFTNINDEWEDNFVQVIAKLDSLIKEGKIRTWGLSNETPWGTMRIIQICKENNFAKPVSIQNAYSLLNRTYEYGMSEVSLRENIPLLPYSPLAMGLLTGKYNLKKDKPEDRINKYKSYMTRYNKENQLEAAGRYLQVAENHDIPMTKMSLAFVNDRPFVASNIIGATSLSQLKENIESAQIELSKECLDEINQVHHLNPNPCP